MTTEDNIVTKKRPRGAPKEFQFTSERARKAALKRWEGIPRHEPTTTVRLTREAVQLARRAWPEQYDRIIEESEAVKERATSQLEKIAGLHE